MDIKELIALADRLDRMGYSISGDTVTEAVKLIEALQAQLTASQRREKAAAEDLNYLAGGKKCPICKNVDECATAGTEDAKHFCRRFDWRGPQKAGKGDAG